MLLSKIMSKAKMSTQKINMSQHKHSHAFHHLKCSKEPRLILLGWQTKLFLLILQNSLIKLGTKLTSSLFQKLINLDNL
jgi:hypothetical protein